MSARTRGRNSPITPSCEPNTPDPHAFRESTPLPRPPLRPVGARDTLDPERAAARTAAGACGDIPVRGWDGSGFAQFTLGAAQMGAAEAALATNRAFCRSDDATAERDAAARARSGCQKHDRYDGCELTYRRPFRKRSAIKAVPVAAVFYLMT